MAKMQLVIKSGKYFVRIRLPHKELELDATNLIEDEIKRRIELIRLEKEL